MGCPTCPLPLSVRYHQQSQEAISRTAVHLRTEGWRGWAKVRLERPETPLFRERYFVAQWHASCTSLSQLAMPAAADNLNILIADDQEHVREALAMLLRGHGYSVVLC